MFVPTQASASCWPTPILGTWARLAWRQAGDACSAGAALPCLPLPLLCWTREAAAAFALCLRVPFCMCGDD